MNRINLYITTVLTFLSLTVLTACQPEPVIGQTVPLYPTAVPITRTPLPTPTATAPALKDPSLDVGDDYMPELGNSGYDVLSYRLKLNLVPDYYYISGRTTIRFQVTEENLTQLSLDFVGFDITAVQLNGRLVDWSRRPYKLDMTFDQPLGFGTEHLLTVTYAGSPVRETPCCNHLLDYMGLQYPLDGTVFAASQPDGARYWFPSNDHPEDMALYTFELSVPEGLTAVANGRLISEETANGDTTFIWEHTHPMPAYLAMVAVGPFERVEMTTSSGLLVRHYILPGLRPTFDIASRNLLEAIEYMEAAYGAYPYETFGFITVNLRNVSLETQTLVLLSTYNMNEQLLVHELSHTWFGNWVGLESWGEMWRNEGFATWTEALWNSRNNPAAYEQSVKDWQFIVNSRGQGHTLADFPPSRLLGYEQYFKGALMVDALYQEMGGEAFFAGLRRYFEEYGGRTASDEEFRAVMEKAAGQSLQPVWDQWYFER